jgi:hypothetical protein
MSRYLSEDAIAELADIGSKLLYKAQVDIENPHLSKNIVVGDTNTEYQDGHRKE